MSRRKRTATPTLPPLELGAELLDSVAKLPESSSALTRFFKEIREFPGSLVISAGLAARKSSLYNVLISRIQFAAILPGNASAAAANLCITGQTPDRVIQTWIINVVNERNYVIMGLGGVSERQSLLWSCAGPEASYATLTLRPGLTEYRDAVPADAPIARPTAANVGTTAHVAPAAAPEGTSASAAPSAPAESSEPAAAEDPAPKKRTVRKAKPKTEAGEAAEAKADAADTPKPKAPAKPRAKKKAADATGIEPTA